jgi:NDP-4-keto-2,6-dideoxyhexose 3-C-methyltransferase
MTFEPLTKCRLCAYPVEDEPVALDLGIQKLTGVFPATAEEDEGLDSGPLALVQCPSCHLVQLSGTYDLAKMYGDNYGYRSGLNRSMVDHLADIVVKLRDHRRAYTRDQGVWVDIGSNDGTLLSYVGQGYERIGIDPTAKKFRNFYPRNVDVVEDFFTAKTFNREFGTRKRADVVTSIAMFYDLPDPLQFATDVCAILADDGLWHIEVAYFPSMVAANAFDGVCHEHLEYYGMAQLRYVADFCGLKIVDVSFNDTNGGSVACTLSKARSGIKEHPAVAPLCELEIGNDGLLTGFRAMSRAMTTHLKRKLEGYKAEGKRVFGLGASTKGNVLLQYAGIGPDLVEAIAEVNPDKFGKMTPGTRIPIISEADAAERNPDVYLVLPWHFRDGFVARRKAGTASLLFPLPNLEVFP